MRDRLRLRVALLTLLCSCLLPGAQAAELYPVRRLSEPELLQTYTNLLLDACRHADQFWKSSAAVPETGYWGDGVSDGNQGIRAIGEMVLVCGTLLKYSDAFSPAEREAYLKKETAAIRYATATHLTGNQKCPDGKAWGNTWQSAMWTATLGFIVAKRTLLIFTEVSPKQTAALARTVRLEKQPGHSWLHFKLPEGGRAKLLEP